MKASWGNVSFQTRSQNWEKRPLPSSCRPSVCPSIRLFVARNNSAPTERIFMKLDIWEFLDSVCIKICYEWRVLYMKKYAHLWQYFAELFLQWEMF